MKKFSKGTSIALSVILGLFFIVGFLLSYVPMTFGAKTFVSFSRALNISSDITGGMYGEYNITTEDASESSLISSMTKIKEVFDENGYKNVNVYAVSNKKIRVEVSYPSGNSTFASTYQLLSNVGTGAFSLRNEYTRSDKSIELFGSECVKSIKVYTNNNQNYLSIRFNKKGQEKYEELCKATQTIYIALGDYAQSISVSGVTDYTQFTLSDKEYSNLVALEQRIKLGCLNVELDSSTTRINTLSASLSAGEAASTPFEASFFSSTAFIVIMSSILIIAVIGLAIFAVKFGLYAVLMFVTLLFNSYIFLILMCLMPSIEIGLSSIVALIIGVAVIYTYSYIYVSRIKSEYNAGKSLSAALETAFKKTLPTTLIGNLALFASSLIMYFFTFGEISSVTVVFAITSFLSLFTNILFVPFLIKIYISLSKSGTELFKLKKHAMFIESETIDEQDVEIAKEDN